MTKKLCSYFRWMLVFLRSSLFFILSPLLNLGFLFVLLIISCINPDNYEAKYVVAKLYAQCLIFLLKIVCGLDFKLECEVELPHIPSVVLSNHQSFWDNVIMLLLFPRQSWIIKKELFNIPIFGWGLKMMDPIHVDRQNSWSVNRILTLGKQKLKDNLWVVIFPEATRVEVGKDRKFKPSGVKLAYLAKAPIVLMAHNAGLFWPTKSLMIQSGTVKAVIGPVLYYEDYKEMTIRELNDFTESLINNKKKALLKKEIDL